MAQLPGDSLLSKPTRGAVLPDKGVETPQAQLEPIIGPEQLRRRFLNLIPLVSAVRNPKTKAFEEFSDEAIQDLIDSAVTTAEGLTHIQIVPCRFQEKLPYDQKLFEAYGFGKTQHRPVTDVIQLSVRPSNDIDVYLVPLAWVETSQLLYGQINMIPLTIAMVAGGFIPTQASGGAAFLALIGNRMWIPDFWFLDYVAGFPNSMVPRLVNDLIGCIAAIDVLGQLAATYRTTSQSLGMDGLSQGVGTPGPAVFNARIEQLEKRKTEYIGKVRGKYGTKIFTSNV